MHIQNLGLASQYDDYQVTTADQGKPVAEVLAIQELAEAIFQHLDLPSFCHLSEVCKSWKYLNENEKIWKNFVDALDIGPELQEQKDPLSIKEQVKEFFLSRKEFYQSIQGLYGIDLKEIQKNMWLKDASYPVVQAKNYLGVNQSQQFASQCSRKSPVEFSYQDAFEYVLRRIPLGILSGSDPLIQALTNIGHLHPRAIQMSLDINESYTPWMSVILKVLTAKGLIEGYHQYGCDYILHSQQKH